MDVVCVMAACLPVVLVCVLHSVERHCVCTAQSREAHDRTITAILAKHYIELPDDGSLVIRNMLEQF